MAKLRWQTYGTRGNYISLGTNGNDYIIKRTPYLSRFAWTAYYRGEEIPLSFRGQLRHTKMVAQLHADRTVGK